MNRPARFLIFFLALGALVLLGVLPKHLPLAPGDLLGLIAFATLAVLSEALKLDFSIGPNRVAQSSIIFIPLFACGLVFPPWYVAVIAALAVGATQFLNRVRSLPIAVFNVSQQVLAFASAALVYGALGGKPTGGWPPSYFAFLGMAVTFFAVNLFLVSLLLAVRKSTTFIGALTAAVGPSGGNLIYDVLASPIAIVASLMYDKLTAGGLFLLAFPLLLVRHSYSSKLQLEKVNKDLLSVLVKAIETRDPYTSGHSLRVAGIARMLAGDMGMSRRSIDELETAALLHDIGKIESLYASMISKPHELSAAEKALIRTHASQGADILLRLSAFKEQTIKAVRHHHERFDGGGYPDGLRGTEIPLAARIIMIADSIDAMLSDRPYRVALTPAVVEVELRENAGSQFDPELVETIFRRGTLQRIVDQREVAPSSVRLVAVVP